MSAEVFTPAGFALPGEAPARYVAFDLDSTLVFSKSGKLFADSWADVVVHPLAKDKLEQYRAKGYGVVIISNQAINTQATLLKLQGAATYFQAHVVAAMGKQSPYRKPSKLIWGVWQSHCQGDKQLAAAREITPEFYCGDAAGAELSAGKFPAYEWSDVDRKFAAAIGTQFVLPHNVLPSPPIKLGILGKQQAIVLVGNPGSGKSEFARYIMRVVPGKWKHIEQDAHGGGYKKTLRLAQAFLKSDFSIIVDATHPTKVRRTEIYNVAAERGIQARVMWLPRNGREANKRRPKPVPEVAYKTYTANFEDPRDDEGIIVDIVL